MNKQGQSGIVGFLIYVGVFVLLWAFFIANLFTWVGEMALASGQLTGLELFIMSNLNIIIFILCVVVIGAYGAFGGQQ